MNDDALVKEIKIEADRETVFEYLLDPDKLKRWKATDIQIEPRVGGAYRMKMAGKHMAAGEFVAIERPSRIVYTWGWEDSPDVPPGSSTVEVTLEADGVYTLLRLVHRDLPNDEQRTAHKAGWDHYFARLAVAAAGGDPGPDPMAADVSQ